MKRTFLIIFLASVIVLVMASCSPANTATPLPVILLNASSDTSAISQVKASAVVVPAQETRMSFIISGMVEEITVKEGDLVQTGQTLATLDTTNLEFDLIAAEAALTSVENDAQMQRQPRKKFSFDTFGFSHLSPPAEKILIADTKVEQARSTIEVVKASIAQGTLTAPFEGTVIKVNVSPGEYVQPGQVIIELARLDNLKIETTDLSELNITAVKIGQPATIFIEALNEEFSGRVTEISPISDTIGGDVVFKVTIQLDEQPETLLWGMSADVDINLE